MRTAFLFLAALPCLAASGARAADVTVAPQKTSARMLNVAEVATSCPPVPAIVARGRRGMGEPGSFYAYWDWRFFKTCNVVIGR